MINNSFKDDSSNFLDRIVEYMDEKLINHYDPAIRGQSKEWKHAGSPRCKAFGLQYSAGQVLAFVLIVMGYFLQIIWNTKKQVNEEN